MPCEVTIKLSNDVKSLTRKYIAHEKITASFDDSKIKYCLDNTKDEFNDIAEKIKVSLKLIED